MTKAQKVTTPWGGAELVEELTLRQQAGDKRFASLVQLLENQKGERLVRFAYSTGGVARRGPVTLRSQDLARLRIALLEHPALSELLSPADDAAGSSRAPKNPLPPRGGKTAG